MDRTVCEVNGELLSATQNLQEYHGCEYLSNLRVHITVESLRRSAVVMGENARSGFLEHKEDFTQHLQAAWCESGLSGVLSVVSSEKTEQVHPIVKNACKYLLLSLRLLNGMHLTIFPHLKYSDEEICRTFSANSDWSESPIRHMAWHSRAKKYALALKDDTIRVHYSDNVLVPMLKHKQQRNITDMSWKPLSSSALAVASQTATLIWNIDPNSLSTRPSSGSVQLLPAQHCPITSVVWHPHGYDLLYTCSAQNSNNVVVWDVSMKRPQVKQRIRWCGGVSRLLFSPDGSKLLATTSSNEFRVFETGGWESEKWRKLVGRVQTACWTPKGTTLLFALEGEAKIFSLQFTDSYLLDHPTVGGGQHASVAMDLTTTDDDVPTIIHTIVMDPTGQRLAVLFSKDDPERGNKVELFSCSSQPVFSLSSRGYITGGDSTEADDDVHPTFIAFKPNFDLGACLTVCFSDGLVDHIPLYFNTSVDVTTAPSIHPNTSVLHPLDGDSSLLWTTTTAPAASP